MKKRKISPRLEGFNPLLAMSIYSSPYCSVATPLSGILNCLPSGNLVLLAPSVKGEMFFDQITGDIYTCDQDNILLISVGDIDQGTAADMQKFLKLKNQTWLKVTTHSWHTKHLQIPKWYILNEGQGDIFKKILLLRIGHIS